MAEGKGIQVVSEDQNAAKVWAEVVNHALNLLAIVVGMGIFFGSPAMSTFHTSAPEIQDLKNRVQSLESVAAQHTLQIKALVAESRGLSPEDPP